MLGKGLTKTKLLIVVACGAAPPLNFILQQIEFGILFLVIPAELPPPFEVRAQTPLFYMFRITEAIYPFLAAIIFVVGIWLLRKSASRISHYRFLPVWVFFVASASSYFLYLGNALAIIIGSITLAMLARIRELHLWLFEESAP
ncbi:MAG: hypothetical protein ACI8UO_000467 [Verrucomicrobiales bacterium]|jgi:hypothetical protein